MKYPSIAVITPTYNSSKTIGSSLKSVRNQNYPQSKIKIFIVDGGSKDSTEKIVKKYNVKWIPVDPKKQNVEYNKSIGIKKAKEDLLLMIDHDNILQNKNTLREMIQPFLDNPKIIGVETYRYHYSKKMTLLDRYFALFGVTDPLAYYLGKADRMSYLMDGYDQKYNPQDAGDYYLVKFKKNNISTIGANGFLIKREILIKNADLRPGRYFPIDVNVDLIRKGHNLYAFTKGTITHLCGHGSVMYYLQRRMLFVRQYYLSENNVQLQTARRYSVYEKQDFSNLLLFIFFSLTFIKPLFDSTKGYYKIHDNAWFLHPLMCFSFVLMYGYVIIEHKAKLIFKK